MGFAYRLTDCAADEQSMHLLCQQGIVPDVVLCPFSLPGTNVLCMMNAARKLGCQAPFILLAYDLAEEIAIELLSAGIEDYINRSTLKRLPVSIRKAVQRHQTLTDLKQSHELMETSELALRNMVRNMPMAVAMFDLEMRYLIVSDMWIASAGVNEHNLLGKCLYDVTPQSDREVEIHRQCLAGQTYSSEKELIQYNGQDIWIRVKVSPWYHAGKDVAGLIIFAEDITKRIESEQQLELTIEAAHLGLWSWDCRSDRCQLNERGAEIYGCNSTEVSMLEIAKRIHPDDVSRTVNSIQQALIKKTRYSEQYRFIRPDGLEITVHGQGHAVFGDDGLPVKMHGVILDLTERAALERAVRESEQLFRDMAENIAEVFWLTDKDAQQFLYISPRFYNVFGVKEQDLYDNPLAWETNVHPDDRPGIAERFAEQGPRGTYDEEYRILHPDGRLIWVRDRAFPVRNEQGEMLRIAGICEDITLQKTAQL
jgi:PAS domain S-box-containing protein